MCAVLKSDFAFLQLPCTFSNNDRSKWKRTSPEKDRPQLGKALRQFAMAHTRKSAFAIGRPGKGHARYLGHNRAFGEWGRFRSYINPSPYKQNIRPKMWGARSSELLLRGQCSSSPTCLEELPRPFVLPAHPSTPRATGSPQPP